MGSINLGSAGSKEKFEKLKFLLDNLENGVGGIEKGDWELRESLFFYRICLNYLCDTFNIKCLSTVILHSCERIMNRALFVVDDSDPSTYLMLI